MAAPRKGLLTSLAALAAAISKPFRRKPRKIELDAPLRDSGREYTGPSLRGTGKASRVLRQARRRRLSVSFTRVLAHRPMFTAPYGKVPALIGADKFARPETAHDRQLDRCAEWDEAIEAYRKHWARARANSTTLVRDRKGGLVLRG